MKGRKPKDVAAKLLAGNPGKRNLVPFPKQPGTPSTESFVRGPLEKPDYLDEYESREWDRLTDKLGPLLAEAFSGMVLIACSAYSDLMHAREALKEAGSRTYETEGKNGGTMIRNRPEVGNLEKARRAYQQALAELGATPVGHTRVKQLPEDNQTELPGIAEMLG